jgi:sugar/nucleoside kinase (ribokinase family)
MNLKFHTVLSVILVAAGPPAALAGSLECQGNIISPGITEAELLEACGEPTSRDGAEWLYKMPGDLPMVVTFGNDGVVTFIRDATDLDSPASPLGDSP